MSRFRNSTALALPIIACAMAASAGSAFAQSDVAITGGSINGTVIGNNVPAAGAFTTGSFTAPGAGNVLSIINKYAGMTTGIAADFSIKSSAGTSSNQTTIAFGPTATISGTGQGFAENPILTWAPSATMFGAISEFDGNNNSTAGTACEPSSEVSGCSNADGIRLTGLSGHNGSSVYVSTPMTDAILITQDPAQPNNPNWYDGIEMVGPGVMDWNIHINNDAAETLYDQGTHNYGLDLNATYLDDAIFVHNGATVLMSVDPTGDITTAGQVNYGMGSNSSQMLSVYGGGSDTTFQLSPQGGPQAAGNTIGQPSVSGSLVGYVTCEDGSATLTWQVVVNRLNGQPVASRYAVLTSNGANAADWSISAANGNYGTQLSVTSTSSPYLYCAGTLTQIRIP